MDDNDVLIYDNEITKALEKKLSKVPGINCTKAETLNEYIGASHQRYFVWALVNPDTPSAAPVCKSLRNANEDVKIIMIMDTADKRVMDAHFSETAIPRSPSNRQIAELFPGTPKLVRKSKSKKVVEKPVQEKEDEEDTAEIIPIGLMAEAWEEEHEKEKEPEPVQEIIEAAPTAEPEVAEEVAPVPEDDPVEEEKPELEVVPGEKKERAIFKIRPSIIYAGVAMLIIIIGLAMVPSVFLKGSDSKSEDKVNAVPVETEETTETESSADETIVPVSSEPEQAAPADTSAQDNSTPASSTEPAPSAAPAPAPAPAPAANNAPSVSISGPQQVYARQTATYTASASDPDGDSISYSWGSSSKSMSWSTPGQYTVSVTVTDSRGASRSASLSVRVI